MLTVYLVLRIPYLSVVVLSTLHLTVDPVPSQVYKVLFGYVPQKEDELELVEGDYVSVSTADQGQTGKSQRQTSPLSVHSMNRVHTPLP